MKLIYERSVRSRCLQFRNKALRALALVASVDCVRLNRVQRSCVALMRMLCGQLRTQVFLISFLWESLIGVFIDCIEICPGAICE